MVMAAVTVYSLSTCSHCSRVKTLLTKLEVDCEVVDVDRLDRDDRKAVLEIVKGHNERLSFPTTVIGAEVVVGYKADQIRKALQQP